jgi:hypothetical protein
MIPKKLRIKHIEEALDLPASEWHGKCTFVSSALVQKGLIKGAPVYGHYLGPVDPSGYWGMRGACGFIQHGWVLLKDGRVLDPTRFSFENVDPYIHIGDADPDYDEGGNIWRAASRKPCPEAGGKPAGMKAESQIIEELFEHLTDTPFYKITWAQAHWVANLTPEELDFTVADIYKTLKDNDLKALIPHDNWARAVREGRVDA